MLLPNLKATVKSIPTVHEMLLPISAVVRRGRLLLQRSRLRRFRSLCAAMADILQQPFFVKVGANDGSTGDPCSDVLLGRTNWKGLLIEPVPYCFDRLKH